VALAGKGDDSATTCTFVSVGEGEGLTTVGVGEAVGLATVGVGEAVGLATVGVGVATAVVGVAVGVGVATAVVGVAVLFTDDPARGTWALPCPSRGRSVGGLEGTSVAVGVAVGV
jgi:hypothetical protein